MSLKTILSFVFFALLFVYGDGVKLRNKKTETESCGCVKACELCVTPEVGMVIKPNCSNHARIACFSATTARCERVSGNCEWIMDAGLQTCLNNIPVLFNPNDSPL
jgi:hypothetical protein